MSKIVKIIIFLAIIILIVSCLFLIVPSKYNPIFKPYKKTNYHESIINDNAVTKSFKIVDQEFNWYTYKKVSKKNLLDQALITIKGNINITDASNPNDVFKYKTDNTAQQIGDKEMFTYNNLSLKVTSITVKAKSANDDTIKYCTIALITNDDSKILKNQKISSGIAFAITSKEPKFPINVSPANQYHKYNEFAETTYNLNINLQMYWSY